MSASPSKLRQVIAGAVVGAVGFGTLLAIPAGAQSSGSRGVNISGSSSVEPITSLVAELFSKKNSSASIRVDGPGTGDGFKLFCAGSTDASDASRIIKPEEVAACDAKGITYTELPVGIDGLTVVVNKSSKLKCVDQAQLYGLFGPESDGSFATAQTLATAFGSTNTALPVSGTVKKFTPGPESGTYDSFIELAYQKLIDGQIAAKKIATTVDTKGKTIAAESVKSDGKFPNDNDIIKRVASTPNGIGFLGYAYYKENTDSVKSIAVVNPTTKTCVKASKRNIRDATYAPLSRLLYIYPNNAKVAANPELKSFMNFYMTKNTLTKTVAAAGYVPLSSSEIATTLSTWKARAG